MDRNTKSRTNWWKRIWKLSWEKKNKQGFDVVSTWRKARKFEQDCYTSAYEITWETDQCLGGWPIALKKYERVLSKKMRFQNSCKQLTMNDNYLHLPKHFPTFSFISPTLIVDISQSMWDVQGLYSGYFSVPWFLDLAWFFHPAFFRLRSECRGRFPCSYHNFFAQ